jgi:TolC family type I secretion outer membrane protein
MPRATPMLAVVAVLLAAGPAAGGPLEETLALVYLDNPRLVTGRAALRAADESVALAQAGGRASVMLRSSAGVEAQDTSRGSGVVTPMRQSLGLTQPVYSGGETTAATARAESLVLAERARLGDLEQRVLMETIGVFTAVAREQAVVGRARDNEKRLTAQLDATRERLRLGDVSKTDVAQSEARQAGGVADRVQAEGELDAAVAEYIHVVGDAPGRLELPELPDAPPETGDDTDVERSFVYQEAQYELAAAEAEIAAARSVSRPRLALMGDVSYVDEPNSYTDRQGTASLGATLQVPLYQGGSATARLRQSRDLREQRQHTLDEARRAATAAITTATHDQRTAIARIASLQKQADAAAFALDGVRQEALVGSRTVLDVLDAEAELFRVEVALLRAQAQRVLAAYRLRAAMGQLTAEGLTLDVTPYDTKAHYREVRNRWFGIGGLGSTR